MELTLTEIIKKYSNIEDKIPSVWETYEEAGIELAQDLVYTWDIQNTELIRVISLVSGRVKGLKITQHIDPMFSFAGLYPEIQKVYNILPDPPINTITKKKVLFIPVKDMNGVPQQKYMQVTEGSALHKKLLSVNGKLPEHIVIEK